MPYKEFTAHEWNNVIDNSLCLCRHCGHWDWYGNFALRRNPESKFGGAYACPECGENNSGRELDQSHKPERDRVSPPKR